MPTPQEFVARYGPLAQKYAAMTGIPAELFLAIGASESNWGAAGSIFGIKGSSPSGRSQTYQTWEMIDGKPVTMNDTFAVYDNPEEGFQHFVGLVSQGRYKPAWDYLQQTGDWRGWIQRVNQAGYATDPEWARKVTSIATSTVAPILGSTPLSGTITQSSPPAPQQSAPVAPAQPTTPAATRADPDSGPTTLAAPRAQDTTASTASPAQPRSARYDQQLDALWSQLAALDQEARRIRSKPTESRTPDEQARLTELEGEYGFPGQIDAVYERIKTLEQVRPEDSEANQFPANEANFALGVAGATTGAAADAAKNWGTAWGNVAGLAGTSAGLVTTAAQLESSYWDGVQQALTDIFGAEDRRGQLIWQIMAANRQDAQEQVRSAMDKGQLDQQAAENVLQAVAARQAAHLGYAAKVLEQAQWIDSVRFRNAMRRLPPGTMYQPGFEPDSTINSSLKALGLNPTVIHAQVVADSEIDPITALRDSDTAMPAGARPGADYDQAVAGVQAAAARTQALQPYQGQQINPSDLNLPDIPAYAQQVMAAAQSRPRPDFAAQQGMIGAAVQGTLDSAQRYDTANQQSASVLAGIGQQYLGENATWRQPRVVQNPNAMQQTQQGTTVQSSPPASTSDTPVPGWHWEGDDLVSPDGKTRWANARNNPNKYGLAA